MTVSFSFGGTTLSTYGKVTLINDYIDMPESRGNNIVIPFRHGAIFERKYFGERKMTFGMVVTAVSATALETVFDTMRANFGKRTEQTLSITMEDSTVRTAQATVNEPMDVERITNTLARVVVTFTLANPILRLSTAIADNTTTIDASPKAMVVANPGTVEERDPTIILTGPLTNVTITNTTVGCSLTYTGVISGGHTVTIGTLNGEYYATHSVNGNVIGNVTHAGAPALMIFVPGNNTLSITSSVTTTGTVKATFNAPYL